MESEEVKDLLNDNGEYKRFDPNGEEVDEENLKAKLQIEEEKLVADILLVELDNANKIDVDTDDEETRSEIREISHDIIDITNIW